ncbi:RNA polymerase-binding protein DksA [Mizugakiibacter sediminis]|uniref:RNA polymerase-binding transcription factor DksA n=1 Tax=Mizugakiibacter sediminis TaxID=1475481 RepID=A0A0K8QLQ0_9GAMM|nr:RNA polymerase-binding protein DksA [Mizugakiibacter sediminis]
MPKKAQAAAGTSAKAARPASRPAAKRAPAKPAAPAKPVRKEAAAPRAGGAVAAAQPAKSAPPQIKKPVKSETAIAKPRVAIVAPNNEPGITREDGRYALPATVHIELPKGYRPSPDEEYMNPMQLAYFRNKLREWRDQLVEESRQTMENLREEVRDVGDDAERATRETENSLELRTRDRYRKLIAKIDKALRRIEEGRYGYCEETDEEIGVERLEARPIATLSLDAQERREHLRKQMGD